MINRSYAMYSSWLLTKMIRSIGPWGLLGLVIICICLFVYLTEITKLATQITKNTQELNSLNSTKHSIKPSVEVTQTDSYDKQRFYEAFPIGISLPNLLELIEATAKQQQLVLNRGDYKLTHTKQGHLSRYEFVLPVVGKYVNVRQFVNELLEKMPWLALSGMQIKRENTLSPVVEARLSFILFIRGDKW